MELFLLSDMEERDENLNYISPFFSLPHGDELSLQSAPSPNQLQSTQHDMFPIEQDKTGKQKLSATPRINHVEISCENKKRKIIRREVEKQRRQQMGSLYASLRTLLPPEYIKGKRSISDHMTEAANYIRNLHKKIEELKYKRDGLRNMGNSTILNADHEADRVTVRHCSAGLEVVISSGLSDEMLPLSRVLRVLVEEGLNILNSVSTKVNKSSTHAIQSQVCCQVPVNLSGLQRKLIDLVTSSSSISSICAYNFCQDP
ncbi:hypothetical protein NE237_005531 [Protea cynaroides]|uniref:BHLH domain-containing protein n=1 Tax=Protea cynaroides TaxID=273540 RepID=A0A9Q0QUN2_9MAGN|nr:hypothetical protein NE237_005531 [Protea cynaroides]